MNKVDYFQAIKLPFTDPKKLIIGVLLSLPIPIVSFVTNTIVSGYALYCGKSAYEGKHEMPDWQNWLNLWLKGFVAGIIGLAYLIPAIVSVLLFSPKIIQYFFGGGRFDVFSNVLNFMLNPMGLVIVYGTGILLGWLLFWLSGYLTPIAALSYVIDDKLGSAFDVGNVFRKTLTRRYFVAWLVLVLVGIIVGNVALGMMRPLLAGAGIFTALLFLVIASIAGFAIEVFKYTVYGNVLAELKK